MRGELARKAAGRYGSSSPEATERLGELLGAVLQEGDVVILEGDLGAGKTQLVKGVARALGACGEVTSPTFTLLVEHSGGRLTLFHLDLYRLESAEELGDAGVLDVVGAEGVSLIEWGSPYAELLAPERLELRLEREIRGSEEFIGSDSSAGAAEPARLIRARGEGKRGRALARALDKAAEEALAS